jgi:putative protease
MDDSCLSDCEKATTLTNIKGVKFFVEKSKGNFNRIWSATNLLNTDIAADVPGLFSGFSIDLRDVTTETLPIPDKSEIIRLFENHLLGKQDAANELHRRLSPTTNIQYAKGV